MLSITLTAVGAIITYLARIIFEKKRWSAAVGVVGLGAVAFGQLLSYWNQQDSKTRNEALATGGDGFAFVPYPGGPVKAGQARVILNASKLPMYDVRLRVTEVRYDPDGGLIPTDANHDEVINVGTLFGNEARILPGDWHMPPGVGKYGVNTFVDARSGECGSTIMFRMVDHQWKAAQQVWCERTRPKNQPEYERVEEGFPPTELSPWTRKVGPNPDLPPYMTGTRQ